MGEQLCAEIPDKSQPRIGRKHRVRKTPQLTHEGDRQREQADGEEERHRSTGVGEDRPKERGNWLPMDDRVDGDLHRDGAEEVHRGAEHLQGQDRHDGSQSRPRQPIETQIERAVALIHPAEVRGNRAEGRRKSSHWPGSAAASP